jgi:hypothetical protein
MVEYTAKSKVAAVQAAPVWLDADATIEKSISLIAEAARNGAAMSPFQRRSCLVIRGGYGSILRLGDCSSLRVTTRIR